MRRYRVSALCASLSCCLCSILLGSAGPDDRTLTDPHSVTSQSNEAARPAPIDDLFYTRGVFGPAWSPTASRLFSLPTCRAVSICGRCALRADGPFNSAQSDDLQSHAIWSPDGKWIVYQQDHAGNELHDLYALPSEGGEPINLTNTPEIRERTRTGRMMAEPSLLRTSRSRALCTTSLCSIGQHVTFIS